MYSNTSDELQIVYCGIVKVCKIAHPNVLKVNNLFGIAEEGLKSPLSNQGSLFLLKPFGKTRVIY
jgi:hypothetical protein